MESGVYFSVVVPTYERHESLMKLLVALRAQEFKGFEVVIVDQSAKSEDEERLRGAGLNIKYFHVSEKGAGPARNFGVGKAEGSVIAFTDDDCIPDGDWLLNAKRYFDSSADTVGLEGLIYSDMPEADPSKYRVVMNVNFEGIGFMTANMFYRKETVERAGLFDTLFDTPFREDTDLGWRVLEYGGIPYAKDVRVLHPVHPVTSSECRESKFERNKFFVKDAILYGKHPGRYLELFSAEGHFISAEGFWHYIQQGAFKYKTEITLKNLFDLYTQRLISGFKAVSDD